MRNLRKILPKVCVVGLLALVVLWVLTVRIFSRPTFCVNCHEMHSSITSWQASSHSKSNCLHCHDLNTADKTAMLFNHFMKRPLKLSSSVNCQECHNGNRIITPSLDLIIPHTFHQQQGIQCIECHPAVGHKYITTKPNNSDSNSVMALCIHCHYERRGNIDCRTCHRNPPSTLAHNQPNWILQHGGAAIKDIRGCNKCHQYTLFLDPNRKDSLQQALAGTANYAQDNAFCADCHRKRPSSHTNNFLHDHAFLAVQQAGSCEVCHSFYYPLPTQKLPEIYCQQCHVFPGWVPLPFSELNSGYK